MNASCLSAIPSEVAGVAYLSHEATEIGLQLNVALPGLGDAGNDIGQHKAGEGTVRNAVGCQVIVMSARYNQRKIPVGLFPSGGLRVAVR